MRCAHGSRAGLRLNERSSYRHARIAQVSISTKVDDNLKTSLPRVDCPWFGFSPRLSDPTTRGSLCAQPQAGAARDIFSSGSLPPLPANKAPSVRDVHCTPYRKLFAGMHLFMKWPRRIAINLHEGKLSVMSDLEPRIRELIRLIAAEADPEKRKALAEDLERLLSLEPRSPERRHF
jgi:hypothetical protein